MFQKCFWSLGLILWTAAVYSTQLSKNSPFSWQESPQEESILNLHQHALVVLEISPQGVRVLATTQGAENQDSIPLPYDEIVVSQLEKQVDADIQQLVQEPTEEHVSILIDSLRACIKAEFNYLQSNSDIGFTTLFMLKLHRDLLSVCESQPHDPVSIVDYIQDMAILG